MSLAFSDTTNKNGIIQHLEKTLGFNDGEISGNTTRLAQFTSDVNLALDSALHIIFKSGGTWNFDDSNHTDYPILTANLVSGQQDYSFTEDGSSNLILDVFKVMAKTSTTDFQTLTPRDQQRTSTDNDHFSSSTTGTPLQYDKTANGIFLYPTPDTSVTGGLKLFVNREASYFTTASTSTKAGFSGLYHRYLVLHPAYNYAMTHSLSNRRELQEQLLLIEQDISEHYARRARDEKPRLVPNIERTR